MFRSSEKKIIALDLGSSFIRGAVMQKSPKSDNLQILSYASESSKGIRKGYVVSPEETALVIRSVVAQLEKNIKIKIKGALVNFNSYQSNVRLIKNAIMVSRADSEVSQNDIDRTISEAESSAVSYNREILHIIPRNFNLDGEKGIKDPLGLHGKRLEINVLAIDGFVSHIKNLYKSFALAGLDVEQIVFSPLCNSQAVLSKKQKELGVAVLDIGASTSSLAVFEEGDLLHAQIFPVGSSHVTNDIAMGFKLDIEIAEKIKIEYGKCDKQLNKKGVIKLSEIGLDQQFSVSTKELSEVIDARILEIFDLVNKELKKIDRAGLLPAGIVLTGGGANLKGLVEFTKKELKLPTQIGKIINIEEDFEHILSPEDATLCGLFLWADAAYNLTSSQNNLSVGEGLFKRMWRIIVP
jgi:cell division protein FtsA